MSAHRFIATSRSCSPTSSRSRPSSAPRATPARSEGGSPTPTGRVTPPRATRRSRGSSTSCSNAVTTERFERERSRARRLRADRSRSLARGSSRRCSEVRHPLRASVTTIPTGRTRSRCSEDCARSSRTQGRRSPRPCCASWPRDALARCSSARSVKPSRWPSPTSLCARSGSVRTRRRSSQRSNE